MSNNSFSSLENITLLFNNLNINNALPLKYFNKLVNDFLNLLNNSDYYDVEIKVGEDEDIKIFKAHSIILRARSLYFKTALSDDWIKKSDNGNILFEKENIYPSVFEILLIYMYNGIINIDNLNLNEILNLLEACDELNFNELIDDLQNYLINEKNEWLCKNLIYVHGISSKHQPFNLLQDFCNKLICQNPGLILKSNDVEAMEKSMLISILENDNLKLDEIDIWNHVIQWGIGQNEETFEKNISEWNENNFKELKMLLNDIIPLIRFDIISSDNFFQKITPFKKIIDKEVYEELLRYYLSRDTWQPRFLLQKGPRTRIGKLLNLELKSLISGWIDQNNASHDFELVLCGSQDGFSRAIFEEKCYNIEQTVVLMKIKKTGELVGGYNPVCWNIKGKSPNENYWIETNKSFIFKINENQLGNSILSRVKKPEQAIFHVGRHDNYFMNDNIKFYEVPIYFNDLGVCNSINNEPYCYYSYHNCYENSLNFINSDKLVHLLEEYEVYKLIKKNQ